jgi:RNase P subunit RPR2
MANFAECIPKDLIEKSILHLHAGAQSLLPLSQSISSHLTSSLIAAADENDLNLPKSYIETRVCQRCGTLYLPGVTCVVRTTQSRRQKRKGKGFTWVIYECKACKKQYKTEIEVSMKTSLDVRTTLLAQGVEEKKLEIPKSASEVRKRRKRDRLLGLQSAIEKSKAEKTTAQLDLLDLMKVD